MEIGTKVERLDGSAGYKGKLGTVVEIDVTAGRARVKWDDELVTNFYDPSRPPTLQKGLRTWVKYSSLRKI